MISEAATMPLVAAVERQAAATGYQCQITIMNNCPAAWGVVIQSAGVKFFYRDNTDYTDGPRNVRLSSGQSATFVSNDANKCVYQYFAAMVVTVPGQGSQTFTTQDGVEDGKCLIHTTVVLGPKSETLTTKQLTERGVKDVLGLTKA